MLSKVIERHVHDSLCNYLKENDLIYPRQSGFRKGHNTETALIQIIDQLLYNLGKNLVNGMILVDYSKSFNMVIYHPLMEKLKVYGVDSDSLSWFKSYLSDRQQLVSLASDQSDLINMKYGVSQGSILGPLFFIVFMNDLPLSVSNARIDLYADDTTIISSSEYNETSKLQESLNNAIIKVSDWAI